MYRRRWLRTVLAGAGGLLAGCTGGLRGLGDGASPAANVGSTRTPRPTVTSVAGTELPLPDDAFTRGAPKDLIPAVVEPSFGSDWQDLEISYTSRQGNRKTLKPRLSAEDRIIGVTRGGEARAYPLRVLNWHEVVNDHFGGPLLVTFCPLCGSGVAARRTVRDEPTVFGVSGLLWNSDLVMYDRRTESLWSQIAGAAVQGPMTGHLLSLVPSTIATWDTWRRAHPDTAVLLPPPESNTVQGPDAVRDYTRNPYALYEETEQVGLGANELPESAADLHPKTPVLGIVDGATARAYPLGAVAAAGVVNDSVGDLSVVVTVTADQQTVVGYVRTVDDTTLSFGRPSERHLRAGGSRWEIATGRAVDGPYEGTRLRSASRRGQLFWFAWVDFQPDTAVYSAPDGA